MFLCGGLSFYTIGILNERPDIQPSFLTQMILGTLIITVYEFMTGLVVNLIFHLQVWDYSDMPFNLKGQVCLPFMFVWFFLTPLCIVTDDLIRYTLFHGKKTGLFLFVEKTSKNRAPFLTGSAPRTMYLLLTAPWIRTPGFWPPSGSRRSPPESPARE